MNNTLIRPTTYSGIKMPLIKQRTLPLLVPLTVFIVALLPRIANLDTFLTADEDDQIMFASLFLKSALQGDLSNALVLGYPGVPTLVLGACGVGLRYMAHYSGWYPLDWVKGDLITTLEATTVNFGTFAQPLDFIVWVRLPMAISAALCVVAIWFLANKLLNEPLAIIGTLLIAFDPFILAHTRVIHVDAPLSYFMFATFLAFILYLVKGNWGYLIASGLFAGLAALSKTGPSAFLGPILIVSGLWYVLFYPTNAGQSRWVYGKRYVLALLGCGIIGAGAFFALWPTMWSQPLAAVDWIVGNLKSVNAMNHPTTGVFWGGRLTDQSPFYYLWVLPYHLTLLNLIGVGAMFIVLGTSIIKRLRKQPDWLAEQFPFVLSLVAYLVLFVGPVSLVSRRGDRYILPVYFALAFMAAVGIWWLAQQIARLITRSNPETNHNLTTRIHQPKLNLITPEGLLGLGLTAQIVVVLTYNPYYLAYYNPVMSFIAPPSQMLNIGWGEGLDAAARYLNEMHENQKFPPGVAAWYSNQFAPYYNGYTTDLSNQSSALYSDYTVFYLNQVQRGFPSAEILEYFRQREPLEVIKLGGVEYAWIFDGPVVATKDNHGYQFPVGQTIGNGANLVGLDIPQTTFSVDNFVGEAEADVALFGDVVPGIPITLHWETISKIKGEHNVYIRLVDEQGTVWGQVDRLILAGLWRPDRWKPGFFIQDEYRLPIEAGTPPGTYHFEVGLYDFETGHTFGVIKNIGNITLTPPEIPTTIDKLPLDKPINVPVDKALTIIGDTYQNQQVTPGAEVNGKIFWQLNQPVQQDYQLQFWLRPSAKDYNTQTIKPVSNIAASFVPPQNNIISDDGRFIIHETTLSTSYPTSQWRAGELLGQGYHFRVSPYAPPGQYPLMVSIINPHTQETIGDPVQLAHITVEAVERNYTLPDDVVSISAFLNEEIELVGYKLHQSAITPTDKFGLTLYWQCLRPAEVNYTVFVHAIGPDQSLRGQWDSMPVQGNAPTSGWLPGEIIADYHEVPMHDNVPPWKYDVFIGMYNADTGERLPIYSGTSPTSDNRIWVDRVQVVVE